MNNGEKAALHAQHLRDAAEHTAIGLAEWNKRPEVKILISLLPPLTNDTQRECFRGLIESAFAAGMGVGAATLAGTMLRSVMAERDRK
jgi:hypothetical protein